MLSRMANAKVLESNAAEHAVQYVKTTFAKPSDSGQTLALPGTLQGAQQAPIAARATGYLKRWTKDIGASVQKGELLAEIESPEIDQQLSQAIAARQQTAGQPGAGEEHDRALGGAEEARRGLAAGARREAQRRGQASANLAAADANVERLRQMQGFTRVTAPFSGVITRRAVDTGDLIDSGGKTLFVLTQMDPLRIYVNVPQAYAQLVRPGQKVVVTQAELRGKSFAGEVVRSAGSIDTATRTMQVEIKLANRDGALMPGAFVQVSLPLLGQRGAGGADQRAAVPRRRHAGRRGRRGEQGAAASRTLGRNLGEAIEIVDGIGPRDRLVVNPSDSLAEGDAVAVNAAADDGPAAGRPAPARPGPARRACLDRAPLAPRRDRPAGSPARRCCSPAASPGPTTSGRRWRRRRRGSSRRPGVPAHPTTPRPRGPWWEALRRPAPRRPAAPGDRAEPDARARLRALEQARAFVRTASASQGLNANIAARATRQHISANRPLTNYGSDNFSTVQNDFVPLLVVSYELDLAGRVRRSVESAEASADQSAADLENARLLLGADLATAYFNLRATDIELDVVARSIALQRRSLDFVSAAMTSALRPGSRWRSSRPCSTPP
jgi:RND family efflux transporter MFP subunit